MVGPAPVDRPRRLFADGLLWRWVAGLAYAGLVALEVVGNESWRTAATPYLDIALIFGLFPIAWRSLRRKSARESAAEERAALAALKGKALDKERAENYGLLDEAGNLIEEPPTAETTIDVISPRGPTPAPWLYPIRIIFTMLLVAVIWFVGLLGLALVGWLRSLV